MDYQKVYDSIIARAKTRTLIGYSEKHHIIPRCLGGIDTLDNLVELTAREHYICHRLLVKIYPESKKLIYAYWMMSNMLKQGRDYRISSRAYSEARELFSLQMSGDNNPNKQEETREKISKTMKEKGLRPPSPKGKKRSPEHQEKLAKALRGRKHSEERRKKNSEVHIGLQRGSNNGMYKYIDLESFKEDVKNGWLIRDLYKKYGINQTAFYNRLEECFGVRSINYIRNIIR